MDTIETFLSSVTVFILFFFRLEDEDFSSKYIVIINKNNSIVDAMF